MRVLLDTHAYLWFIAGDQRLSSDARRLISDPEAELVFSIASLWEIAIKHSLGKLELARPFAEVVTAQLQQDEIQVLGIETRHLARLTTMPFHHRDPFDRMIIAQALEENVPVISRDQAFASYSVEVVWS